MFEKIVTTIRDIILPVCRSKANIFVAWLIRLPWAIAALLLFPIIAFAYATYYTLSDLALNGSASLSADATRVPTFYVPRHLHSAWIHTLLLATFGCIFGGIHCVGWNLPFPTYAEQKLWRVASLAVTIIPIILASTLIVRAIIKSRSAIQDTAITSELIFTFMYASARLILLGQAVALLRHQPPSAFIAVDWTKVYPHIF